MPHRSRGHRRWTARATTPWPAALAVLVGAALGWVVWTRRTERRALSADPWATPVPTRTSPPAASLGLAATTPTSGPAEPAAADGPHGPGSAAPRPDGSAPEGFDIKGNIASRLYHPSDSPYYGRTRAGVWFADEASAEAAGFRRWDHKRRG